MSELVRTPIVDKNGRKTTVLRKAASAPVSKRTPASPKTWKDEDGYMMTREHSFLPKPADFIAQDAERTSVRDNPAVRVTFPDAPDRELIMVADPGDGSYHQPAIVMLGGYTEGENVAKEDYISGGQSSYSGESVVKTEDGELLIWKTIGSESGYVPFSKLKSVRRPEGVYDYRDVSEYDEYAEVESGWADSNGNKMSLTVLPNLPDEAVAWLLENVPVYIPESEKNPDESVRWRGENPNYGSSRVEAHNSFGR